MKRAITRFGTVFAAAALAVVGLSACSKSSSDRLTFCVDPTYAPAEYYKVQKNGSADLKRQLVGADIDIGGAVAHKIGKDVKFVDTKFNVIIDHLVDKKCDGIISMINDTAARRTKVSFVDYLSAGQDLMLKKSGPSIANVAGLAGHTVSVAEGTTEELFLKAAKSSGNTVTIKSYVSENDAIVALKDGKVDAYFGDAPIVQNVVDNDSTLVRGPELVKPIPIGIAMRPGDSRIAKVQKAVNDLYADGSMGKILTKWKFTRYAITP